MDCDEGRPMAFCAVERLVRADRPVEGFEAQLAQQGLEFDRDQGLVFDDQGVTSQRLAHRSLPLFRSERIPKE